VNTGFKNYTQRVDEGLQPLVHLKNLKLEGSAV
jgi:hypothetical protein